jgi:hypothetical protein
MDRTLHLTHLPGIFTFSIEYLGSELPVPNRYKAQTIIAEESKALFTVQKSAKAVAKLI